MGLAKAFTAQTRQDDFQGSTVSYERDTLYTVAGVKATVPDQVDAIDWTQEVHGKDHPVPMAITSTTLYNMETGEVMAVAQPGFYFYWFHSHPHIAPVGWDGVFPCRKYNEPVKQ